MEKVKNYEDLLVWQKAHSLVLSVYQATKSFPNEERYGIVQQLRRAAASVATNIVEGFGRYSRKEYIQFLYISRGSLSETEYHLRLSQDLNYIKIEAYKNSKELIIEIGKMLNGLINSLRNRDS